MVVVTTSGYFLSVLGPYLSDAKNNDSKILNHIIDNNIEHIKKWIKPSDIFVVDRGFRDSFTLLEDLGIKVKMPSFMKKGDKQLSTKDANSSRLVTKVRWVVEAANARIKRWRYLAHVLPNTQIPFICDYINIVCGICNKYLPPLNSTSNDEYDQVMASQLLDRLDRENKLQQYVLDNNLNRHSSKWTTISKEDLNFPNLDNTMLEILTLGTYQVKLSKSYMQEYIDSEAECRIQILKETQDLVRVHLQSRHVSSKSYFVWIKFDSDAVKAWYCQCRSGARTVGTCSHVAAVVWYLSNISNDSHVGIQEWDLYVDDACQPVDFSDSDSDSDISVVEE
ncbi:hypothetical protein ACF0H5_008648 [Mactra antiquata]